MKKSLKIMPLGGLGEVGMNCLVYEYGDEAIMVDCGVMFHDEDLGVDVVHPAFDYVLENSHKLKAVILTHGHEDHIGATPFLLQGLNVPLYGTPLVLKLIDSKLKELAPPWKIKMTPVPEDSELAIGPFTMRFAGVNHSIPQSISLFISTPVGNILHTSDFKIGSPSDQDLFDRTRFESFRRQGVDLLLSDSTNIQRDGFAGEESTVIQQLREIIEEAPSRVFITLFPSNIRRVYSVFNLAGELGRQVVTLGRSMDNYLNAAKSVGIAPGDDLPVIPLSWAKKKNDADLLFLVSGTQGEPRSAMTKIARQDHAKIMIQDDDVFIFSSRHIPGNEMAIGRVMNNIARQGARIYHVENTAGVHVSGHGNREDMREMLKITAPKSFIPIHGNYHYLTQHADLAGEMGIREILILGNGDVAQYSVKDGLRKTGRFPAGKVYVDGLIETGKDILDTRRSISKGGIVTAIVVMHKVKNRFTPSLKIVSHGVLERSRFSDIELAAGESAEKKLDELARSDKLTHASIKKELKKNIEKYYSKYFNRRPFVTVEIIDDAI